MSTSIYAGELLDRATSTASLETRLNVNSKYSSTNFNEWLMPRLAVREGEDLLDVGCGNGAQATPFSKIVGSAGSVSAVDISEESVNSLLANPARGENVEAVVGDMADLNTIINQRFRVRQYDLAHSSYALYYAADRHRVMDIMRGSLKREGRLAVFTPNEPHGMVNFVKRRTKVPSQVEECFGFGPEVLEPYFRKHFWDVSIHLFHNIVRIPTVEEVMDFYRSTTYYDNQTDNLVKKDVEERIRENGFFEYEKNGYLIVGQRQF